MTAKDESSTAAAMIQPIALAATVAAITRRRSWSPARASAAILPLPHSRQRLGGQIIFLNLGDAAFNNLPQIKGLRSSRLPGQLIKPVRDFRRKPDRSSHSHLPLEYMYSLYPFAGPFAHLHPLDLGVRQKSTRSPPKRFHPHRIQRIMKAQEAFP